VTEKRQAESAARRRRSRPAAGDAAGNGDVARVGRTHAVLAHLKQGSIRVRPGRWVQKGELLGQCGNSWNFSKAHLHFHLQHGPVLQDGLGIKCFLESVALERGGRRETLKDYSPVKGDVVAAE
jgi:murein DD-endopeptidase MepM/ murein hydrolase activator NlpD